MPVKNRRASVCCMERCEDRGERHYGPSDAVRIGVSAGYEVGIVTGLPGRYDYLLRLKTAGRNDPYIHLSGARAVVDFISKIT